MKMKTTMRSTRHGTGFVATSSLLLSVACSTSCSTTAPRAVENEPRAGGEQSATLHIPTLLPSEPSRSFLDLGPVLVPEGSKESVNAVLLRESERLDADAFIAESRDLGFVYGGELRNAEKLSVWALVGLALLSGQVSLGAREQPGSIDERATYRAIRYVSASPQARPLDSIALVPEKSRALESEQELSGQLALLHRWLVRGEIEAPTYESARSQLFAPR